MHGRHRRGAKVARVLITCETCGTVREYLPSELRQRKRIRFCSRACFCRASTTKIPMVCAHCGVEFLRDASRLKRRFCSPQCSHIGRRKALLLWPEKRKRKRNSKSKKRSYDVAKSRLYHAAYRNAHRARIRQLAAASRARHRLTIAARTKIRRTKIRENLTTPQAFLRRMASANGVCVYCGRQAPRIEADHIEPLATGGDGSLENFMPCCRFCNASKGAHPVQDWLADHYGIRGLARAVVFLEKGTVPEFLNEQ